MASTQKLTRLARWRNSYVVQIPSEAIKQLNLTDNQALTISIKDNSIILTPIPKTPTNIHDLFADWKDDGIRDRELDWGNPVGREFR